MFIYLVCCFNTVVQHILILHISYVIFGGKIYIYIHYIVYVQGFHLVIKPRITAHEFVEKRL